MYSFIDYYEAQFNKQPSEEQVNKIAYIISYNVFQMDGLAHLTPFSQCEVNVVQLSLFDEINELETSLLTTKIKNWQTNQIIEFKQIVEGENEMKFDVVIGNLSYQEDTDNRDSPIYHLFMEEAYQIADIAFLITPTCFLFNARQTPSKWNEKMLLDEHSKVIFYEQMRGKIFSGTVEKLIKFVNLKVYKISQYYATF